MRFNCSYEQSGVTAGTNIASWTEILRQIWHIVIVYDLIPATFFFSVIVATHV